MSAALRLLFLVPLLLPVSAGQFPAARAEHIFTYHVQLGGAVLYGGYGADGSGLADTWIYDTQWHLLSTEHSPGARWGHCATYDEAQQAIVLFGGTTTSMTTTVVLSDTWLFDGAEWHQVSTAVSPPARTQAALAYDPQRGVSVLYGGQDTLGQPLSDTWEFDGSAWNPVETATGPEAGLYAHAMVYDPQEKTLLLFGGTDGSYDYANTWVLDDQGWVQRSSSNSPYPRREHVLVYDGNRRQVLLYGGEHNTPLADTFAWTGESWQLVQASAARPPARSGHAACYDTAAGRVLLYGGWNEQENCMADLWSLDLGGWALLTPASHVFFMTLPYIAR